MRRWTFAFLLVLFGLHDAHADEPRTLRMGIAGLANSLLYYHDSTPQIALLTDAVFDTLIAYDERRARMAPLLARAWRRVDDRTLEFDLREDVKWHDGVAMDADDVVYTLNWLGDEATKLHKQYRWGWIDHAEKLGRHKLRLVAKYSIREDLARLATAIAILPEHKHGMMLGERAYFGRTPIGTGPYRGQVIDRAGIVLERARAYAHGGEVKVPSNVERFSLQGWLAPERPLTAFRAGELDVVLDAALDDAGAAPLALVAGYGILVLSLDARSDPLADVATRRALIDAIDRPELAALAPGARVPTGLCWTEHRGCTPARRRIDGGSTRLNLSVDLVAHGPFARRAAGRVAERWRALGVTTRIDTAGHETLYMRQRDGALQIALLGWHSGEMPDVAETLDTFAGVGFWDRHNDAGLHQLIAAGDEGARQAFQRLDEQAYAAAVGPFPAFVMHTADVAVDTRGRLGALGITLSDLSWR